MAHEGVLWFNDRGSEVLRLVVQVGDEDLAFALAPESASRLDLPIPTTEALQGRPVETRSIAGANMDADDPGEFPMFGVPLDAVAGLVADHGATLLHIENDRSCGDDWVSYRYFVQAAGSR